MEQRCRQNRHGGSAQTGRDSWGRGPIVSGRISGLLCGRLCEGKNELRCVQTEPPVAVEGVHSFRSSSVKWRSQVEKNRNPNREQSPVIRANTFGGWLRFLRVLHGYDGAPIGRPGWPTTGSRERPRGGRSRETSVALIAELPLRRGESVARRDSKGNAPARHPPWDRDRPTIRRHP